MATKKPTRTVKAPAPKKSSSIKKSPSATKPSSVKKPSPSHVHKKPSPEKARPVPTKPAAKKAPPKPTPAKSTAPAKAAPAPKPVPAKAASPTAPAKPIAKGAVTPAKAAAPAKGAVAPDNADKGKARDALRSKILGSRKPAKPIAFSLEEVRELAKSVAKGSEASTKSPTAKSSAKPGKATGLATAHKPAKPAAPNHVKAASLADILGFNPRKASAPTAESDADIPDKFRRYYRLLIELRNHVTGQLDQHTEDTLKRSSKEDAGDLSSYGQHMADAGTDTFDRDFALSLVSSEQEALSEIEAAIQRIKAGTYGICEISQKPIAKERLLAVPFTRYSADAQKEIERNRYRSRTGAGLFGELGEEGGAMGGDDGGDD